MKPTILQIWKNRGAILEGIRNSIFRKEDVEEVAEQRTKICQGCESYDMEGSGCVVPGSAPCCNANNGGCGCRIAWKVRALSEDCPKGKWKAILSFEEEQSLREKLMLED